MMIGYVLLALGIVVFVLSFMIPAKTEEEKEIEFSEEMIRDMVGKEVESAKDQITDIVDETITYAMEKTERSMDRLTNEKMMAVNEYSDTVLSEINKNHQEVVFLYDMLNDKHENIKSTVSEVELATSKAQQAVKDAEVTAMETKNQVLEAKSQVEEAKSQVEEAKVQVEEAGKRMSALDKLKMMAKPEEEFAPLSFPVLNSEENVLGLKEDETKAEDAAKEVKPARKKRTTKPKVKEEALVLGDAFESESNKLDGNLELVTTDSDESVKPKNISGGPEMNLGEGLGPVGGRNNNERILELHGKGKSNMAIAKELGLGIGEVKLVIDLFEGM